MPTIKMLLLLLLLFVFGINADLSCDKNVCDCLTEVHGEIEYQCPPKNYERGGVIIHRSKREVQIDCYNTSTFNTEILPRWSNSNIISLDMRFCPFPESNLAEALEKLLNISDIFEMRIRYANMPNSTLTKEYFIGLENLERLDLSSNTFKDIEEDVFANTPKLTELTLGENELTLKPKIFQFTPKLRHLALYGNGLSELPEDIFKNLKDLKLLELWHNNITTLSRNHFKDLQNLKSLDLTWNKIKELEDDVFADLTELIRISLQSNLINKVPLLFHNNHKLELVKLSINNITRIPDFFFNSTNLKTVEMDSCNLVEISENAFVNAQNLEKVILNNNFLKHLPENLFKLMQNLKFLVLSRNKFKTIPALSSLNHLESLNLHNNNISAIGPIDFKNLEQLKDLDLSHNRIENIDIVSFTPFAEHLEKLDLSYNNYAVKTYFGTSPLNSLIKLKELNLSHNNIENIDIEMFVNMLDLKELDLSYNKITSISYDSLQIHSNNQLTINLVHNQIKTIDFSSVNLYKTVPDHNSKSVIVHLDDNPINCDCRMLSALSYFRNEIDFFVRQSIQISNNDLECNNSPFRNTPIKLLRPHMLLCPLNEYLAKKNYSNCPIGCDCSWRPYDKTVVVDCALNNLYTVPSNLGLPNPSYLNYNQTELRLYNNNFINFTKPENTSGYWNVTKLFLSGNKLETIEWLPPKLQYLTLNDNKITRLDSNILKMLSNPRIQNVSLDNNPWTCDCETVDFAVFLRSNTDRINPNNVRCNFNGTSIHNLTTSQLCVWHNIIIYTIIALLTIGIIITFLLSLFFCYKQPIKIWLYSKNLCLWYVSEEELDKDREFDAFISYATADEDFVVENLIPALQSGPQPYKLLWHREHWIPGKMIPTQINDSVQNSKRTVIVLSKKFVESDWGKMEFHVAHAHSMEQKRIRVIVILLEDVEVEKLDEELKMYLKTNTYVRWGEPHFWKKLRYALPHGHSSDNSDKISKTMNKIDDKFILTPGFTPDPNSTPPVLTLDAGLLKKHPLNIVNNQMNTPPAESGLLTQETV